MSFSTPLAVYDSLGSSHVLTFNFTKSAAGSWDFQVTAPAADVGQTGAPVAVGSGTLTFDGAGKLTSPTAASPVALKLTGLADGANDLNLNWNLLTDRQSRHPNGRHFSDVGHAAGWV